MYDWDLFKKYSFNLGFMRVPITKKPQIRFKRREK